LGRREIRLGALFKKYSQKKRTKRIDAARVGAANPATLSAFRKSEVLERRRNVRFESDVNV
jgi:hypothetical protein